MLELDDEQRAAIECRAQRIGVIAGAGTGKTRVITGRVARLCEETLPHRVLAVTFTKKAAAEMVHRVEGLGVPAPEIRTLHAWCGRFIRDHAEAAGRTARFRIYDQDDAIEILRMCGEETGGFAGGTGTRRETLLKHGPTAELYERRLREGDALDFDGLERVALDLLKAGHGVGMYEHVLVDEAQDLSPVQARILAHLRPDNTCMVGDPRQSIYAFRGSDPAILRRYLAQPGVVTIELRRNYRSRQPIVTAANHVSPPEWQTMESGRELAQAEVTTAAAVRLETADDAGAWVDRGLAAIGADIRDGVAVLARTWRELHEARHQIEAHGLPCRIYADAVDPWLSPGPRMLARALAMAGTPEDDNLGALIVNWGRPRFHDLLAMRARATRERRPLLDVAGDTSPAMRRLYEALVAPERFPDVQALGIEIVEAVLGKVPAGYAALLEREDRTLDAWRDWWDYGRQEADRVSIDNDAIHLLTIHGAKGLEWPVVFGLRAESGLFPPPDATPEDQAEARRLLYVLVTRARDHLLLQRRRGRDWSPFLSDALRERVC